MMVHVVCFITLILMEIMMTAPNNTSNQNNLIWLDMEMSGLLPDTDRILELAAVVTDAELNVLGESPVFVVHQTDAVLEPESCTPCRRHLARRKYSKAGVAASKIQVAYRVHRMRQSLLERLHAARRERDSRFQVGLRESVVILCRGGSNS